jgi:outer membrane protein TolC
MTPESVIRKLLVNNPTLRVSALLQAEAQEALNAEEARFPFIFQVNTGVSQNKTPSLGSQQNTISEHSTIVLGSQLSRTFSSGLTATLRAEGERFDSSNSNSSAALANPSGIGYQTTLRATLSQPLLSGYGSTVNETGLRVARIEKTRLQKSHERQSSELLRDALLAYWELWYAARTIEIQTAALALASNQEREANLRVKQGALSPADALKFRTQVATLSESLLTARSNERTQAFELGRLLGVVTEAHNWVAAEVEPETVEFRPRKDVLWKMLAESPAIADLKEAVRIAEERQRTAGDEFRSRLDLQTWVEATGLGKEKVGPALQQTRQLDAVSFFGGLTYQATLDAKRLNATRAQAVTAVRIARANLDVATQQIEAQVSQLLLKADLAKGSFEAATLTQDVAKQQAENERQRFSLGAATPLDVQVAEDAFRQAQQRVLRARVDQVKAWLSLAHASGELLARYVVQVPNTKTPG